MAGSDGIVRQLHYFYAASFLAMFAIAAQVVGVPLVAKRVLGADVWQLALLGVVGSIVYTSVCYGTGLIVGRVKPLNVSIVGALIYGVAMTSAAAAQNLWHLAAAMATGAFGNALFWPMLEAAIAQGARGRGLSRRMGAFNIFWSIGDVSGIIIAGALYDVSRYLPFVMIAVASALIVASLVLAKYARVVKNGQPTPAEIAADALEVTPEVSRGFTRAAWVGCFVSSGVMQVIRNIFADAATDVFRMSGAVYGLAIGTVNVCRTLTFIILRVWRDWHYRPRIYLASAGLLSVGLAGFVIAAFLPHAAGIVLVFISFAMVGLSVGATYYASIFYSVHTEEPAESKTRLHETMIGAGGTAAIFASGASSRLVVWASASAGGIVALAPVMPFVLCALVAAAGVYVSTRFLATGVPRSDVAETGGIGYPDSHP